MCLTELLPRDGEHEFLRDRERAREREGERERERDRERGIEREQFERVVAELTRRRDIFTMEMGGGQTEWGCKNKRGKK